MMIIGHIVILMEDVTSKKWKIFSIFIPLLILEKFLIRYDYLNKFKRENHHMNDEKWSLLTLPFAFQRFLFIFPRTSTHWETTKRKRKRRKNPNLFGYISAMRTNIIFSFLSRQALFFFFSFFSLTQRFQCKITNHNMDTFDSKEGEKKHTHEIRLVWQILYDFCQWIRRNGVYSMSCLKTYHNSCQQW